MYKGHLTPIALERRLMQMASVKVSYDTPMIVEHSTTDVIRLALIRKTLKASPWLWMFTKVLPPFKKQFVSSSNRDIVSPVLHMREILRLLNGVIHYSRFWDRLFGSSPQQATLKDITVLHDSLNSVIASLPLILHGVRREVREESLHQEQLKGM